MIDSIDDNHFTHPMQICPANYGKPTMDGEICSEYSSGWPDLKPESAYRDRSTLGKDSCGRHYPFGNVLQYLFLVKSLVVINTLCCVLI